jgi:ABC-type polysaccharide/polyol phosphate transport system ATPase subunit
MKPGAINAEQVSRRFRVYPHRNVTLKEAILRPRHLRSTEIWALRDVDLSIAPGESVGFVGRNGSGKTTLLRLIAGIFSPTSGRLQVGGTVGSLLELGAGFHPDFTGRENIYLSASIYGLGRRFVRERMDDIIAFSELEEFIDIPVRTYSSGMYMRLGFAIAIYVEADILLLDEVFAVGDEAFQRKCVDRVMQFRERGGTVCFVSHNASAVEQLCERAVLLTQGRVEYDGKTTQAIKRYHKLLAAEESPAELRAGLREWGSGEVRIEDVRLEGPTGVPVREELAAGDPLTVHLRLVVDTPVPPPRLSLELRGEGGGLLGSSALDLDKVGWEERPGERLLRFELPRLPVAEGRFQLGVTLTDRGGTKRYHRIDGAAKFEVTSTDDGQGLLRLEGEWRAEELEVGTG